jgi:Protein of unknown function (DUF3423).
MSTSIRIAAVLYEKARQAALIEQRTIAGQIEYWANIGRVALENPDLPTHFIVEALSSTHEPREQATDFVPRATK